MAVLADPTRPVRISVGFGRLNFFRRQRKESHELGGVNGAERLRELVRYLCGDGSIGKREILRRTRRAGSAGSKKFDFLVLVFGRCPMMVRVEDGASFSSKTNALTPIYAPSFHLCDLHLRKAANARRQSFAPIYRTISAHRFPHSPRCLSTIDQTRPHRLRCRCRQVPALTGPHQAPYGI